MSGKPINYPGPENGGATVLLSGGLDSSVLLHYLARRLGCRPLFVLSFSYGQRHHRELAAAAGQVAAAGSAVADYRVVELSFFRQLIAGFSVLLDDGQAVPDLADIPLSERDQPVTYVPNRNMLLLALAAAYAESRGCRTLYYGAQVEDEYGYWDCSPEFIERLNAVFGLNRRKPVEVRAPFMAMRKSDELRLGVELEVDFSRTWSCYRGGDIPCDCCPTCVERRIAFQEAGLVDPLLENRASGKCGL